MAREPHLSEPRRVLVVDAYEDGADSLAMILRTLGAEAFAVYDGETALSRLHDVRPDLILLDLGLPRLTGFDVARAIRAREPVKLIRIVALTGQSRDESFQDSLDAGFDDYLMKPVTLETLTDVLESIAIPDQAPYNSGQAP